MVKLKLVNKIKSTWLKCIWILAVLFPLGSCQLEQKEQAKINVEIPQEKPAFKFWTWITAQEERTDESFAEEFAKYNANGIDAILINTYANPKLLSRLVPIAERFDLEVHAWLFTINRPSDSIAEQHPEWYAVSRDGKSCFDDPPYVDYYKWLCPTRKASRDHILSLVEKLAKVNGVASVHLDYIRYSDIFLPVSLLPMYNLKQDEELPSFDFCYCDVCISEFQKIHHKNPRNLENPALDIEWKNFRLNKVKAIVDKAYLIAHEHNKLLTSAVFPYPEMADHMVRQRWDKWDVDAVLPMAYNSFYNEEVDWVGYVTKQGVEDLKGKATSLHTGIYVHTLSAKEVSMAINFAKKNGASGVSFFDGPAITEEQWSEIRNFDKMGE